LYPGYGTHFSYIWVGTPAQRQSVIIDTGSHYTAFPCSGCQQCGKHTDDYFDPKKSRTAVIPKCGGGNCEISQSYAEGSTWKAYKVTDALHVGGLLAEDVPRGESKRINFTFGCQTYETGLFRTQLADGIMGMAASSDTLPYQLVAAKRTANKIFALCFRVGGGIMTIGGVDQKLHKAPEVLNFAKLRPSGSWFGVRVMKVQFQDRATKAFKDISSNAALFDAGKGSIVDSGTTDTYLPASLATPFKNLFKEITGFSYSNSDMTLTAAQVGKVPDIVFTLLDAKDDGSTFTVTMPFSSYMDQISSNKFAFRVYLNEGTGAVLGANFMNK
jgi:ferredoxin